MTKYPVTDPMPLHHSITNMVANAFELGEYQGDDKDELQALFLDGFLDFVNKLCHDEYQSGYSKGMQDAMPIRP